MEREEHENLLSELLTPDLEASRKTEILQLLRTDYTAMTDDIAKLTTDNTKLKKDNDDLIISNSKLFRQIGVTGTDMEKKEEQKNFSESVTIEQLEKE